ncbi:MAG: signal peptidase II [Acidobacteria bacterium]|nr:signal peptidase II [Acidobacteriota bacterium]MDA1235577.1 signal peptidase II [Acidobacteriota bacterium]
MALAQQIGRRLPYLAAAVALFGLDRWSKVAIVASLPLYSSKPLIPGFFDLVHTRNTGMAFSMLNNAGPLVSQWILPGLSAAAVIFIIGLLWRTNLSDRRLLVGLALVLAGAAGNLYDRAVYGFVVDFLDVYVAGWHWPAFNVADSCITIGAGVLLLDAVWKSDPAGGREAQSA